MKRLLRADVKVSAIGVQRRLQALAFMGWSCQKIAEKIGSHYRPLNRLRDGGREHVMQSTHDAIDRVYRELCMTYAPGRSGWITRGYANRNRYVSPLAWTVIDDPNEMPAETWKARKGGVDRELVEWLWREGLTDSEISDRTGYALDSVGRVRRELGLEAGRWAA